MPEISVGPCNDCGHRAPLTQYGRFHVCPACLLSRRRAARLIAGEQLPKKAQERDRYREPLQLRKRWHLCGQTEGGALIIEPISPAALSRLRSLEQRRSADGDWAELIDEEGEIRATLVRLNAVKPRHEKSRL